MKFGRLVHADYGDMLEIETGRRVPMWRTFVLAIRKCYISAAMPFIVTFIVINSSSLFIAMQ